MKLILLVSLLLVFTSCSTRQINGKEQTFTEYVVLNKNSEYKGKSKSDWDNQPEDNFPGIRLIKWSKQDK